MPSPKKLSLITQSRNETEKKRKFACVYLGDALHTKALNERVSNKRYGSLSAYIRALIQRDLGMKTTAAIT